MMKSFSVSLAAAGLALGLTGAANAAPMAPKAATAAVENADIIEVGERRCRRCGGHRDRTKSRFSLSFSFGTPQYYHAQPHYYVAPPVVYYAAPAPWTPAWFTYCKTKYRSFDPHTGRYKTYSGHWKVCH